MIFQPLKQLGLFNVYCYQRFTFMTFCNEECYVTERGNKIYR